MANTQAQPSIDAILAAAADSRASLATLEQALMSRIDAIEGAAFDAGRPFTPAESAERDQLRAALGEVRDAFRELGFVTLEQLDSAADVQALHRDLQDVNQQIDGDLQRLKQIARFADIAAKVADGLAQTVGGLVKLIPLLP